MTRAHANKVKPSQDAAKQACECHKERRNPSDDAHDVPMSEREPLPIVPPGPVRSDIGTPCSVTGVELDDVAFDPAARRLTLKIHPKAGETSVTRFIGTRRGANLIGKPRKSAKCSPSPPIPIRLMFFKAMSYMFAR